MFELPHILGKAVTGETQLFWAIRNPLHALVLQELNVMNPCSTPKVRQIIAELGLSCHELQIKVIESIDHMELTC